MSVVHQVILRHPLMTLLCAPLSCACRISLLLDKGLQSCSPTITEATCQYGLLLCPPCLQVPPIRAKRKQHLQDRKQQMKARRSSVQLSDDLPDMHKPAFGEQAQAPPKVASSQFMQGCLSQIWYCASAHLQAGAAPACLCAICLVHSGIVFVVSHHICVYFQVGMKHKQQQQKSISHTARGRSNLGNLMQQQLALARKHETNAELKKRRRALLPMLDRQK